MLTIQPRINPNYQSKPAFGNREDYGYDNDKASEIAALKEQYNEERQSWLEQKRDFEEMIRDKEANLPKPLKATMQGGAVLAAGVLGGMATGYSAKYIIQTFEKMGKSKPVQNLVTGFKDNISKPIAKGLKSAKTYISNQFTKLQNTKTYQNGKSTVTKNYDKFTASKFAANVKEFGQKIADNKVVKAITGAIDAVFSAFGEGVVKIYNKLAGINYKNATADTLGVAGGISTGAVTLMDQVKKPEGQNEEDDLFEESRVEGDY